MAAHSVISEFIEDSQSDSTSEKTCNDDLIQLDIMREFLEKSREKAAQHHENRISLLESQYLLRLQKSSTLDSLVLDQRATTAEMQNGSIETIHKSSNSNNTSLMTANVSIIEIELDESDEEEPLENKNTLLLQKQQKQQQEQHSNTLSSSPQSHSDSHGISPEMFTPFSPQAVMPSHSTTTTSTTNTTPLKEVQILRNENNNNNNNNNNGSCSVEKIPVTNPSTTLLSGKMMDKVNINISSSNSSNSKSISRLSQKSHPTTQHEMVIIDAEKEEEEENNVTRCLMQSFGNHIGEITPQKKNTTNTLPLLSSPSHSVDTPMEPELQEFLRWQSEKSAKRRESLRMANDGGSRIAKIYAAAAAPELRWPLFVNCASNNKPVKPPLTPDSSPSRFITWIADEVDCFEDLLLHLTPAAEKVERGVVEAVVDVVINKFTAECVVDCILQQQ